MSDLLEFRHFKYLIAVAEEKNISRAAKRLFLAQPSLSIQLKSIEDALSIELLVRVPKGVKLTPAAEVLIAGARQILALRDEVVAADRPCGFVKEADRVPFLTCSSEIGTILVVDQCEDAAADGNTRSTSVAGFLPGCAKRANLGRLLDVKRLTALVKFQS